MQAVIRREYGLPDVVRVEEVPKPVPGRDEVLIRVFAASLNSSDWECLTGKPLYMRMWGLIRPRYPILGSDIAGRVEAVGPDVTRFQPGDEVFGDILGSWGGFAEHVCARETALLRKPPSMTFEQAATLPQAGLVALQGLARWGGVRPGQRVLINGAGGGTGSFAVQLAKSFGAEVTGVDSAPKFELMRSLGADHVLDYARDDFTRTGQTYDSILDLVARRSLFDIRRALKPGGTYALVGGSLPRLFQALLLGPLLSTSGKKLGILAAKANEGLARLVELFEAGSVVPAIERRYPFSEAAEALRHLGEGRALGKIVLTP